MATVRINGRIVGWFGGKRQRNPRRRASVDDASSGGAQSPQSVCAALKIGLIGKVDQGF